MADDYILSDDIGVVDGQVISEHDITSELESFRQQWYHEIQSHSSRTGNVDSNSNVNSSSCPEEPTPEDKAHYLFLQGVSAERSGRLYDAIQYYRKAVQLVPDIESRIDFQFKQQARERQESESSLTFSDTGEADDVISDLIQHIQRMHCTESPNCICQPATEQKAIHIGELPVDIIQYIFKWVVSSDLDVYSLEQLACVSRGFYLRARDEELWRLICLRIWGINCGSPGKYGSYRNMYLERTHLRFNGCYISKCVYYRSGEKGLDNYYRPLHRVEYYRYIRFFPDGKVLMVTSPDNPYVVLPHLHVRDSSMQGLLTGYYKLTGDRVTLVMKKSRSSSEVYQPVYRYRRMKNAQSTTEGDHTFDAEFTVAGVRSRTSWQLVWTRYAIRSLNRSAREENVTEFELNNKNYPPLNFSRVRSFNAVPRAVLS